MNLRTLATLFAVLAVFAIATVDHDKIEPFLQPKPVTVSEKVAIKFKPQLSGEVTGGLKGSNGNDACEYAPKGSQVYGRSGWYRDLWAIMYAWYSSKGFEWIAFPKRRLDWHGVVVCINNPALESPKIVGASIIPWTHHLRDFNKMAEELANLAMDTKKSTQVFAVDFSNLPQTWTALVGFLQRDVGNWIDIHPDQQDDGRTSNIEGVP
ncbi:hypothetical protein PHMEG_00015346 [Phytophthora megakarya]|uniref:Necrosis inducing protein NPP1 n=1 Tax=Phytophthora megakarya TaxID=4795 RepID=A0A225W333_9STRA|nr:hypothetical protein PHMEG_00015346 [Phytophthora megakarya]